MKPDTVYSLKKGDEFVCCACDCPPAIHLSGWKCPIFNKEIVCSDCCLIEALKTDVAKVFSEKLGRQITLEEINQTCLDCGRNNAMQDDAKARDIESGTGFQIKNEGI